MGTGTQMIAIKRELPVKTLPEFIAYAKANPGKLNFTVAGTQNISHLAPVLLFARAGIDLVMVPAKGEPQAVSDLISGQVDLYFGNSSSLLPHINSDKIRLIAVGTAQRIAAAPDIPTVAETLPGFEFSSWNGFLAPAGTPEPIITAVRNEITALAKSPEISERLTKLGIVPGGLTQGADRGGVQEGPRILRRRDQGRGHRAAAIATRGNASVTPAQRLRELLAQPNVEIMPGCYDALSAKLVADAGYKVTFMSGFAVSAARLGLPDTGLISFTEMLDSLRNCCAAAGKVPLIGDGDTGYGNALNVQRTVIEYARAGAACVMIEDQVSPKKCGHTRGKQVISREEARMKIRAAVDARADADILIMARTDARAVHGFDEALARCKDFEAEGADIIFFEAPETEDEMRALLRGDDEALHGEHGAAAARRRSCRPRNCRRSATSSRSIR